MLSTTSAPCVTIVGAGAMGCLFAARLAGLPKDSGAAAVKEAVSAAVLVDGFIGASAWDGAVQRLSPLDAAGRVVQTMLLLDNCEHVLAGAQAVIADLLDAVPGLTILATSREPIGYIDERLVRVPPLSGTQSLELFRQSAELVDHPITDAGQIALAEQVCGHLHGHPLCIRLVAARMFYEPLPMILAQLSGESDDMRMRWRHRPQAGLEGRHRAIGDVIAWSYELCGDKQRLLFDRLSVFAPGYDANPDDDGAGVIDVGAELEAIEVVCADDVAIHGCEDLPSVEHGDQAAVRLARTDIRELLERLVEQSLVSVHMTANTVRYFLLESLRVFAAERLAERSTAEGDEPARLAKRHCYFYRDKVLQAHAQLQERFQRTTNALASAAHDLKTPLAILNGYIELLQSEKLGPLNERQREVLHDMNSSGQRLQHFIQDFLTFSVLETGQLKMQYEEANINVCLSEVCRLWSPRFQERGLALYFLANEKLPTFPFDSPKLQRIISNLLENSSKFTPSGGTVWLHAEPYMWERRSVTNPGIDSERRRQKSDELAVKE